MLCSLITLNFCDLPTGSDARAAVLGVSPSVTFASITFDLYTFSFANPDATSLTTYTRSPTRGKSGARTGLPLLRNAAADCTETPA